MKLKRKRKLFSKNVKDMKEIRAQIDRGSTCTLGFYNISGTTNLKAIWDCTKNNPVFIIEWLKTCTNEAVTLSLVNIIRAMTM